MNMLTNIKERKAVLRTIIPHLKAIRVANGKTSMDWGAYFKDHPDHDELLGYTANKKRWNANNVVAKWLMKHEGIKVSSNGHTPPIFEGAGGAVLVDVQERKALLHKIHPLLPLSPTGQRSWKVYFESHPAEAHALGYDLRDTKPDIWAANLRIAMQRAFLKHAKENNPSVLPSLPSYTVESVQSPEQVIEIAARQRDELAQAVQEQKQEIKDLRDIVRKLEDRIQLLKVEKTEAALMIFDLMVQLKNKQ